MNIKAYHTLSAPVRVGGVNQNALVTIREDTNGKFYYDFEKVGGSARTSGRIGW